VQRSLDTVVVAALATVDKYQSVERATSEMVVDGGRYGACACVGMCAERARTPRQPTYVHEDDVEVDGGQGGASSEDKDDSPGPLSAPQSVHRACV